MNGFSVKSKINICVFTDSLAGALTPHFETVKTFHQYWKVLFSRELCRCAGMPSNSCLPPLQVLAVWMWASRPCVPVRRASAGLAARPTLTTVPVTPAATPAPAWTPSMTSCARALWASPARTAPCAAAPARTSPAATVARATLTSPAPCAAARQASWAHAASTPSWLQQPDLRRRTTTLPLWSQPSSSAWWLWRCCCAPASTSCVSSSAAGSSLPSPDLWRTIWRRWTTAVLWLVEKLPTTGAYWGARWALWWRRRPFLILELSTKCSIRTRLWRRRTAPMCPSLKTKWPTVS